MAAVSIDLDNQHPADSFAASLQRESWSRQQIEYYQANALRACREYAYAYSPFYQRFHKGLMDRPLQELPVLTKAIMMENFDDLITDRSFRLYDVQQYLARANLKELFLDRYQVMATSGSSGLPGIFLSDARERAITSNSYTRYQLWGGLTTNSKLAIVGSTTPGHASAQIELKVNGEPVTLLQINASLPLEHIVQLLNEGQPDALMTYSSITTLLSDEQNEGRLNIHPRLILCGAEALTADMRKRIEATWQQKIFDIYASTEGGVLAAECPYHKGLHLFEDYTILEIVDQNNRPVPPGEMGDKILLTVLFRRSQPLIRYEVTDLVRASTNGTCPCGRPFSMIESIQGRTVEILYFPSLAGTQEKIYPYLFLNVFDALPVKRWQVIQELDGLHVLLLGASEELSDERVINRLRQAFINRDLVIPPIQVRRVTELVKNTSGGKSNMIISRVPRPA